MVKFFLVTPLCVKIPVTMVFPPDISTSAFENLYFVFLALISPLLPPIIPPINFPVVPITAPVTPPAAFIVPPTTLPTPLIIPQDEVPNIIPNNKILLFTFFFLFIKFNIFYI